MNDTDTSDTKHRVKVEERRQGFAYYDVEKVDGDLELAEVEFEDKETWKMWSYSCVCGDVFTSWKDAASHVWNGDTANTDTER